MPCHEDLTQIRSAIQTQQPGKQETGSRDVTVNPKMTQKDLQGSLSETGVSVLQSTISCSLHKAGLYRQLARKKPLLKMANPKARMEFDKKHLDDTAGMWREVL